MISTICKIDATSITIPPIPNISIEYGKMLRHMSTHRVLCTSARLPVPIRALIPETDNNVSFIKEISNRRELYLVKQKKA